MGWKNITTIRFPSISRHFLFRTQQAVPCRNCSSFRLIFCVLFHGNHGSFFHLNPYKVLGLALINLIGFFPGLAPWQLPWDLGSYLNPTASFQRTSCDDGNGLTSALASMVTTSQLCGYDHLKCA